MSSLPPELAQLTEGAAVAAFAPNLAQAFASLACDVALVLDAQGVITRVAHSAGGSLLQASAGWLGQPLVAIVTVQTRPKIDSLLRELAELGLGRRREVNLPAQPAEVPVAFTALRLGPNGPSLAVGHDLRAVAQMQQRFLRVQQELERGYSLALRAAADEGAHEPLNEASRAAFAAWLRAERLSSEGAPPPGRSGGAAVKPVRTRRKR
jgi:hypothetical protein